jgi:preprotein translocase subunit YajC
MGKRSLQSWIILAALVVAAPALWAQTTQPSGSAAVERGPGTSAQPGAEGATTTTQSSEAPPQEPNFLGKYFIWIMLGGFFLLYIFMSRGRRKEQKRRQEMLSSLKKNDKITTIGGIVGTVIEVRDDEVTIKVDESSNTRMKFARWAVRGVGAEGKAEKPGDAERKPDDQG